MLSSQAPTGGDSRTAAVNLGGRSAWWKDQHLRRSSRAGTLETDDAPRWRAALGDILGDPFQSMATNGDGGLCGGGEPYRDSGDLVLDHDGSLQHSVTGHNGIDTHT